MTNSVTINVRVNNQTGPGMTQINARFNQLQSGANRASSAMSKFKTAAISLSPALLPVAAAAVPVAANVAAAGAAVAAFGLAVAPQIVRMAEATQAQTKYSDAVRKHGQGSKEAAAAEGEMQAALSKMTPATREATAGFGALRDATNRWSNSLSSSTMPVFTKSFATFRGMLPGLTPLVEGAATQLERFVTIAAGGVGSGAFAGMMEQFSGFATGALQKAADGMVHFARTFDGFDGGAVSEFMAYARENGPAVGETLRNLGAAMVHLLASAGDLGVSMLAVVNAFAKLVNALPSEFIGTVLQAYAAFKLFGLAAAGVLAAGAAIRSTARALVAFRAAAVTAGGGIVGLRAAFLGLSAAAKTTVVAAGVTALVLALSKLSSLGKEAPPDVDRLTSSLARLGRNGKVSGEGARVFGQDLGELYNKVRSLTDPSTADKIQQFLVGWTGFDSTPMKDAKEHLGAVDKALASLVKGGKADLAAAALEKLKKAYAGKDGHAAKQFVKNLDDYRSALADQKFEQELAAEAMGLFGQAAIATGEKLQAQKQSADGLRQSLQALNDVQRQGLGGMIGFEAAIDAAADAARKNAGALSMTGGKLNLNSEKARNAATALQDLAQKTDEAASSARESGSSWSAVNGIYSRGRAQLIKSAQAMGLTRAQAKALASQLLKTPDKTVKVKMAKEDAISGLKSVQAAIKRTPGSKSVTVKSLTSGAITALRNVGFKVTRLPNGRVRVTANTGSASSLLAGIRQMIAALDGKTANTYVNTYRTEIFRTVSQRSPGLRHLKYADGGPVRGPGTGTSDDVPIMASNGEFVMRAQAVQQYGERFMTALNEGRLKLPEFAKGGKVSKARARAIARAKERARNERQARNEAAGDLTISHFGRRAGYQRTEFRNDMARPDNLRALVSSLGQMRSTIKRASHGGTESRLLRTLDRAGSSLIRYSKQHDKVSAALDKARDKLSGLRQAAAQLRESVASGITGSANVTRGTEAGGRVTLGAIMGKLVTGRDQSKAFAGALSQLRRRGLSKSIISDVAQAGLEGGGLESATALLGASKSDISLMNKLQGQITSNAKAAGKTTADAMYGAGIKAAEGVVKGLERNKKRLEKAMDGIAAALTRAIRRGLRISSRRAHGGVIGAAGGGPRGAMTLVGEMGPELVDLPYGSRVRTNGDSRRLAASGGRPIIVHQTITLDGRVVARQIFEPLRGEIRDRGGLASLGR